MNATTVRPGVREAEAYWTNRYAIIDESRSGHINLPLTYNRWLYRRKLDQLARGLRAVGFNAPGSSVLDVAAGAGVYVDMWSANGVNRLTGTDISERAVFSLQSRFPRYSFHAIDVAAPGFPERVGCEYDLVTAIDVLYYVTDEKRFRAAFTNFAAVLRPGGLLVLHDVFLARTERFQTRRKLRTFTAYEEALTATGFEVVWYKPTFFFSVQALEERPFWARHWLMRAIWRRVSHPFIQRFPDVSGRIFYWIDTVMGGLFHEGPSYHMAICRRQVSN